MIVFSQEFFPGLPRLYLIVNHQIYNSVNISQQPVPMQPATYWAAPSGPSPPGAVPVSYTGATVPNQANPQVRVMVIKPFIPQ